MKARRGSHAVVAFVRALVLSVGLAAAVSAQAQGKWTPGPAIPEGANEVIGAAVDGQVLVYGGQDTKSAAMGIFWKLDHGSPRKAAHTR
jgi:hypothetical protein